MGHGYASLHIAQPFIAEAQIARIEGYTWHCNRHAFASRLVMAGVDLRTVAELLGPRTLQRVMRYFPSCSRAPGVSGRPAGESGKSKGHQIGYWNFCSENNQARYGRN